MAQDVSGACRGVSGTCRGRVGRVSGACRGRVGRVSGLNFQISSCFPTENVSFAIICQKMPQFSTFQHQNNRKLKKKTSETDRTALECQFSPISTCFRPKRFFEQPLGPKHFRGTLQIQCGLCTAMRQSAKGQIA